MSFRRLRRYWRDWRGVERVPFNNKRLNGLHYGMIRNMPPLINSYPHRYHPYSRSLALHSSFPDERLACPPHSLYKIYPTDSDVTAIDCPEPLTHKPVVVTAADYFAILEVQKTNTSFPKPDGEPGRKPGKSHKGYVLADVLAWPTEVYKEVQVNIFLSLLLVLMISRIVDHP
jgi:hypothetical protein